MSSGLIALELVSWFVFPQQSLKLFQVKVSQGRELGKRQREQPTGKPATTVSSGRLIPQRLRCGKMHIHRVSGEGELAVWTPRAAPTVKNYKQEV